MKKILVIAPHPDDEVLGCGGTIAKFSKEGHAVYVAILTKAGPPLYDLSLVEEARRDALASHKLLGVKDTFFCDLPAANVDTVPHHQVNQIIVDVLKKIQPEIVFIPFGGDIHLDHQCIFLSSLVALRPNQFKYPSWVCAYEVLSETNWNATFSISSFQPNLFVDITGFLDLKLQAFSLQRSQVKEFPHERSLKALEALALLRGSTVHRSAAEAFVVIRQVI